MKESPWGKLVKIILKDSKNLEKSLRAKDKAKYRHSMPVIFGAYAPIEMGPFSGKALNIS